MNTVIQVLEQMANNASLQSEQAIEQLLTETEVTAEQTEAILNKDVISLERQLDAYPDIICFLIPAEDEEPEEESDTNEEDNTCAVING